MARRRRPPARRRPAAPDATPGRARVVTYPSKLKYCCVISALCSDHMLPGVLASLRATVLASLHVARLMVSFQNVEMSRRVLCLRAPLLVDAQDGGGGRRGGAAGWGGVICTVALSGLPHQLAGGRPRIGDLEGVGAGTASLPAASAPRGGGSASLRRSKETSPRTREQLQPIVRRAQLPHCSSRSACRPVEGAAFARKGAAR